MAIQKLDWKLKGLYKMATDLLFYNNLVHCLQFLNGPLFECPVPAKINHSKEGIQIPTVLFSTSLSLEIKNYYKICGWTLHELPKVK
jgi:hypothetical protein